MTLVVGLTGGIGSGKSTAAHMFADLGAPIIDTDAIAHDLVQPGSVALVEIAARFGESVLGADGALDRKRLRQLVFADPSKRIQLEGILHPLIRARVAEELKTITAPYCILVVPLLFESGWDDA
ncbi:MAG: dephospho-CoA kinase, partial [Gammaproteobacteria bacterium]